ncbi:band 4.1-like protein 2 isoform X9 [Erpetoichthys calabaricus]|uniref:band 4.1-like protein 2 isoform X9 n=1 Tax=Erpetoichthys calabaricus TaxID=27687 RepID=UPI002234025E|nr:band 4.1-like protein 2 isoform X9 [Erpetoichthys calabaricus]
MTTEVGSETEVKKEPEQAEEQPQTQVETEQRPEQQLVDGKQEQSAHSTDLKQVEEEQNTQESPSTQQKDTTAASEQVSPAPQEGRAGVEKKEEQSGSKGIARFLPPWLKKQKSQSHVEQKKSQLKEGETSKNQIQEKEEKSPPQSPFKQQSTEKEGEEARKDTSVEEKEENLIQDHQQSKQEETKVDEKEEEKLSVSSAETQPAKEDQKEEVVEKDSDVKVEDKKEEDTIQNTEVKTDRSIQKVPKKMKTFVCKVTLLDGTEYPCELEKRAKGQVLFTKICEHLNLLEKDYFGLTYRDNADQKNWLDPAKEIKRQIRSLPWQFAFNVKFYPPDPSQLTEDITRYFLCLQLRQDIAVGRLPCSFVTHALLGSYTLQAELGDYDSEEHRHDYISEFQFAPTQTKELEDKVVELHKTHRGLTPAQAEALFLENAKKLSMYGVDLHHAKDSEGVDIMLGVCANGLLIYKDRLRINRFAWPKILKISYKRSNFYIKIRPGETEQFESTIGFKLPNHRSAKRLWKVCVEHHTFFRLISPEQPPKAKFLTLGSKFRYSGRTQAQTRQASTLIDRPAPFFERTSSKRLSRSLDGVHHFTFPRSKSEGTGTKELKQLQAPAVSATEQILQQDSSAPAVSDLKAGFTDEDGKEPGSPYKPTLSPESKSKSLRVEGENIYVRHSNLMLEDLDKTQEDVLKHQASISELKRNFMESSPEPRPNQWEKRLTGTLSAQTQGSLEEEITTILLSKEGFSTASFAGAFTFPTKRAARGDNAKTATKAVSLAHYIESSKKAPSRTEEVHPDDRDLAESTEKLKSEMGREQEIDTQETMVNEETTKMSAVSQRSESPSVAAKSAEGGEMKTQLREKKEETIVVRDVSTSSDSESEEEAEYRPQVARKDVDQIKEEPEENEYLPVRSLTSTAHVDVKIPVEEKEELEEKIEKGGMLGEEVYCTTAEEKEEPKVNGDVSHIDTDIVTQVICCSEPPVVKTEMVTISDAFASQKSEISTKEVPIVHTETKTITYEAAEVDGTGDSEPGVLMTAQTITSESVCTTTTTQITKTVKGGVSETRIEKRIVITGDADIDHDQALAQAIKEAKEQHPDMSVTRVVVHKETELTEEGDD